MNKGTVLVVEDDKAIQNLIGTTLEILIITTLFHQMQRTEF